MVTVETPPQSIDLKTDIPDLSSLNSQSLVDVTVSRLRSALDHLSLLVPRKSMRCRGGSARMA